MPDIIQASLMFTGTIAIILLSTITKSIISSHICGTNQAKQPQEPFRVLEHVFDSPQPTLPRIAIADVVI